MSDYVFDLRGLAAWANLSGNEFGAVATAVQDGRIIILSRVWQEFSEIYPDEAEAIADSASPRHRIGQADRLAAAALADHVDAMFGPYGDGGDWIVASKALSNDLVVVTAEPVLSGFYGCFDGCEAMSIEELLTEL